MLGKEIYKVWAPAGCKWVDWVRPVPFVGMNIKKEINEFIDYSVPDIKYVNNLMNNTAIIVDILGVNSIKEGIALANLGYRPIPLFNGTIPMFNSMATTNNNIIELLLIWGAYELNKIKINVDAPPVFLLDENRLNRYKINSSIFDNSWDIYSHDMPSANYLIENGINKIIVRGNCIQKDLKKILYKYQKNGIEIFFTNGFDDVKKIKIKKAKDNNFS